MADHSQIILKNYNRLVAYGCSNTQGEELNDHLCLGIDVDTCNQMKKKYNSVRKFKKSKFKGKTVAEHMTEYNIEQKNNQKSYAGQLAKLIGIDYQNKAIGGNSQSHIYWQLTKDVYQKKINKNDLILIGCTMIDRYTIFEKIGAQLVSEGRPITYDRIDEAKAVSLLYSEEKLVWEYYNWLLLIKTFAKKHNIKILMVPTTSTSTNVEKNTWTHRKVHLYIKTFAIEIWKELRQNEMITDQGLDDFFFDPDHEEMFYFGHFPEHNHRAFAEHIYSKLKIV